MKKKLSLILMAGGLALSSAQAEIISTNTLPADYPTEGPHQAGISMVGFDFTVRDLTSNTVTEGSVGLKDLSLIVAHDVATTWDVGLAIYENDNGTLRFVGNADSMLTVDELKAGVAGTDSRTWTSKFTNLMLDSELTYTAVLWGNKDTWGNMDAMSEIIDVSQLVGHAYPNEDSPITYGNFFYLDNEDAFYRFNEGINEAGVVKGAYPVFGSTVDTDPSGEAVPEPATATLSLLGLAALLRRRRRA